MYNDVDSVQGRIEMYSEALRERVKQLLESLGLKDIVTIEYPEASKRPLDLVARYDNSSIMVRITRRVSSRRKEFAELKRATEVLNASSLIVAEYLNREELLDDVLYTRDRVGIVSYRTLYNLVRGGKVCIYERNGLFYVKIDGAKLRELRIRHGLSLSQLAQKVGVSTKALYEYEQGKIDMSVEVAERFLNIFGEEFEEVVESVDIFTERIVRSERSESVAEIRTDIEDRKQRVVIEALKHGVKAEAFDLMPSDIVLRYEDSKWFVTLVSDEEVQFMVAKCRENAKLAGAFRGRAIAILLEAYVKDTDIRDEIERYVELYKYSELDKLIKEMQAEPRK